MKPFCSLQYRKNCYAMLIVSIIAILSVAVFYLSDWSWKHFVSYLLPPARNIIVTDFLKRFALFVVELWNNRCLFSWRCVKQISNTTVFDYTTLSLCFILVVFYTILFGDLPSSEPNTIISSFAYSACYLLSMVIFHLNRCSTWHSYMLADMNALDYGSGMAHSYFHGYLKLVLSSRGEGNLSLIERIELFMDQNNIPNKEFPVKKLFILVPKDAHCYPKLQDDPHLGNRRYDIEPCNELIDTVLHRAGTLKRVYRTVVYKIHLRSTFQSDHKQFLYVVAEGATPMLTFREAFTSSCLNADTLKKHKDDVISMFCSTLMHLINESPECQNLAEVVPYDYSEKDLVSLLEDSVFS